MAGGAAEGEEADRPGRRKGGSLPGFTPVEKDFRYFPGCIAVQEKILSFTCEPDAARTMLPITLDPARLRLAVAGDGAAAARRLRLLRAAGAAPCALPQPEAACLPALDLLWIADLPPAAAAPLAAAARARGILVNVEDQPTLCDFRNAAELRRGDLLIAVSTGGGSPGLAGLIRDRIGAMFGPEWADRLATLAARRRAWRVEGRDLPALAAKTRAAVAAAGWLA